MKNGAGFTLIDVLIGSCLMLIIFFGIFGVFQLGMKIVFMSKCRVDATAVASGELERVRNLSYESIGVIGSFPDGILEPQTTIIRNQVEYKIERRVDFIIDPIDGLAPPDDECPNDYKKVEARVSWEGKWPGEAVLVTDVSPENLAQECASAGGILSVSVFNAVGEMIPSPLIEVKDPVTNDVIKNATPSSGKHYFSLAPNTYKVVVSKTGFNSDHSYSTGEIAFPEKPHPMVLEGRVTEISFSIDKVSTFIVETLSPWGMDYFFDSFIDSSKIAESSGVVVAENQVGLAKANGEYQNSGYLISINIIPSNLILWNELLFSDIEPASTQILYQVLYFNGNEWVLVPDSDLAGNTTGFDDSPVDLSGLNPVTYPEIRSKAILSTLDPGTSPLIYDWQVSWKNAEPTSIADVTFHLQGEKLIGYNEQEEPVYKYSQDHVSDSEGRIDIPDLEWDSYTFSVVPTSGLDLVEIAPSPQPIALSPNTNCSVFLYLKAENSLLITIKDYETKEPIFSASARLKNESLGYDKNQYTNEKGQTYFIPLDNGNYSLEVEAPGYNNFSGTVLVSEDTTKIVELERVE